MKMTHRGNVPIKMGHLGLDGPRGRKTSPYLVLTVCQALFLMLSMSPV